MAVQVLNPVREDAPNAPAKKEEMSDLDKILKAVQIANGALGIATDVSTITNHYKQRDGLALDKEIKGEQLSALKVAAQRQGRMDKGELTSLEMGEFMTKNKYQMAKGQEDANLTINVQGKPVYLKKMGDLDNELKGAQIKTQGAMADKYSAESSRIRSEKGSPGTQFKRLPIENQKQIEALASKNVDLSQISQSLKTQLAQMQNPDINEDIKIKIGQGLLKTMNSDLGKDAIGAEEADRLGSLLEYKIANFREPGSFIGRDLDEFIQQAALKFDSLDAGIQKNSENIDALYGGQRFSIKGQGSEYAKVKNSQGGGTSKGFIDSAVATPKTPTFDPTKPHKVIK